MCLEQFAANYTYNLGNENCIGEDENEFAHELDSDIPEDSNEIMHTNVIKLWNGLGQMKKRKRKAVVWWHNFNIENVIYLAIGLVKTRECVLIWAPISFIKIIN